MALMLREGFRVTQASVSRDIREMGLVKLAGRYLSAKRALTKQPDGSRLELEVGLITGLEPVGANLVVVKTRVGAASSVAVVLDQELGETAAGTIAGDDTVFVAVRSRCDQGQVVARLNAWLRQTPPPGDDPDRRRLAPGRQIAKMAPSMKSKKPIRNGKTRGSRQ